MIVTVRTPQEQRADAINRMRVRRERLRIDMANARQRYDEWTRRVEESEKAYYNDYKEKA